MTARITAASEPFPPDIQAVIDRVMPKDLPPFALFTTLARDSRLFDRFVARGFLGKGHLTLRQRELVIARVTAQCGSEYEWGIHTRIFADRAGFQAEHIRSIVHGDAADPCWDQTDRAIIRLCDSLHSSCDVDEALWAELKRHFTDEAVMELLIIAGNYRSVAYLTNVLRLPLEDFAMRFPDFVEVQP